VVCSKMTIYLVINLQDNDRTFCIPCRWLSEDCGQARVIKKYKGNSICSCSSGIKNADCSAGMYVV
jgi:hypothetical protein